MRSAAATCLIVASAFAATALAARDAAAQSCYATTPYLSDISSMPESYYYTDAARSSVVVTPASTPYLLYMKPNSFQSYNVTTPLAPVALSLQQLPWSGLDGEGTHGGLITHLMNIATRDGFPWALVSLGSYGWDFLDLTKLNTTAAFLKVGYKPPAALDSGAYNSATLFAANGATYAVGSRLDSVSINAKDSSLRIYTIASADGSVTPARLTYQTMGQGTRVPVGGANDTFGPTVFSLGDGSSVKSYVLNLNGTRWLIVRSKATSPGQAAVVNISQPLFPLPVAIWNSAIDSKLMLGNWAFDEARAMLYVGDLTSTVVYQYDISDPTAPKLLAAINWYGQTPVATGNPVLSLEGDLLAVGSGSQIGLINVGAPTPVQLPQQDHITSVGRTCAYMGLGCETVFGLTAFQGTDGLNYVARSMVADGDIVQIASACMSTTPAPALQVTGGNPAACGTAAVKGFPGDTFVVKNTSGGSWVQPILRLSSVAATGAPTPVRCWSPATATWPLPSGGTLQCALMSWTADRPPAFSFQFPSDGSLPPGDYRWDLQVTDAQGVQSYDTATAATSVPMSICGTPTAQAAVSGVWFGPHTPPAALDCTGPTCAYLTNDTVQLSASPQGAPNGYGWIVSDPIAGTGQPQTGATLNVFAVPLPNPGPYTVTMAAQYAFGSGSTGCTDVNPAILGPNYNACATLTLPSQPFSVGPISVSDGTATATPTTRATLLRGNPITFSAAYRVASTYTAAFQWGFTGPSAPAPPTVDLGTPGTVKGVIPAGTLSVGTNYSAQFLQASATPVGGGQAIDLKANGGTVAFDVTDCVAPGPATNTLPADGDQLSSTAVTFDWSAPGTGTGPFEYKVVQAGGLPITFCDWQPGTTCQTTLGVGTIEWQVLTKNSCGTAISTSTPFTVTIAPTGGGGGGGGGGGCTPVIGGSFSYTPNPIPAGAQVTFSGSALNATSYSWSSMAGIIRLDSGTGQRWTTSFAASGSYTVTMTASNVCPSSTTTSQTVTVTSPCAAAAAPVASFSVNPAQPRAGQTVTFTDTSQNGPTEWAWSVMSGPIQVDSGSGPTFITTLAASANPYTVNFTASNCKGQSTFSQQIVVLSACDQTVVPTASFTWPSGAVDGFPEQQQPYVGQAVTLTDTSTNSPDAWQWCDFQELGPSCSGTPLTGRQVTVTWTSPGAKNVRLTAHNCVGSSQQALETVTVYPDLRHVVADFTWSDGTLATGAPVTLVAAQGPANGDPDTFTWTFDDNTASQSGASITHTFTCGGPHTVTLTASRANYPTGAQTVSHTLTLTGQLCGPEAVMTVDAAKVNGLNGTSWRTNVRIFNPSSQSSKVSLEFLPINQGSASGPGTSTTLAPNATWVLDDVLGTALTQGYVGAGVTKAALRFTYDNADNTAPIVVSDTYTSPPSGGGNYGELTPGIEVVPTTTPPVLWIAGIRNNGTTTGFRTNYSLVNLRSDAGVQNLKLTLFDATGATIATQTIYMNPLEYRQDSLAKLFGDAAGAVSPNPLAVRVDVPTGSDVQAYVSVMDNLTGDPVLIPAVAPPSAPVFLPAVGHTPGLNGTVWRSDLQITNPDSAPHTWEIKFWPSGQPYVARALVLSAGATQYFGDLLSWVYNGSLTDTDRVSGLVRIAPVDGSSVYPIVQARSFNQTPNGTFGQNITPVTADMGVVAGQGERLLLTGMSSQDIARTNLGFVNLSDTSSVVFSVLFYDEGGNVLNPKDGQGNPIPYTSSLGVGGWDQDLLENRFKNTSGWPALGSNLKAISAVVQVTGGGPGTVYATVIDAQTGDPNFILAQPAP